MNDVEVRLSELHDQALAVGQAHQKMAALEAAQADYRARAEKRIVELEASSRPPADIRDVSHYHFSCSFSVNVCLPGRYP